MASRVEEFDEKILVCAKEEFLEKGFADASLRVIAKNAGVSTSTIYTRYSDKEGLFHCLVEEISEGIRELLYQSLDSFSHSSKKAQEEQIMEYSDSGFSKIIAYIYEHFSEFKLLVVCSPSGVYQEFLESIVSIDTKYMKKFLQSIESQALKEERITEGFLHVVSSAFYSGVFEVVIHEMPIEDARKYIGELRNFYSGGWKVYF